MSMDFLIPKLSIQNRMLLGNDVTVLFTRSLRMTVPWTWFSVCGPSSVGNSNVTVKRGLVINVFLLCYKYITSFVLYQRVIVIVLLLLVIIMMHDYIIIVQKCMYICN